MNKPLLISLIGNAVLIVVVLLCLKGCRPDNPCGETHTITQVRDSIVAIHDTLLVAVPTTAPRLIHRSSSPPLLRGVRGEDKGGASINNPLSASDASCADTLIYESNSNVPNSHKINVTSWIASNSLLRDSISFVDLRPDKIKIVNTVSTIAEKPKSAMIKVFAGATGSYRATEWGLGVKGALVFDDSYLLAVGFDAKNLAWNADLLLKLKFRK